MACGVLDSTDESVGFRGLCSREWAGGRKIAVRPHELLRLADRVKFSRRSRTRPVACCRMSLLAANRESTSGRGATPKCQNHHQRAERPRFATLQPERQPRLRQRIGMPQKSEKYIRTTASPVRATRSRPRIPSQEISIAPWTSSSSPTKPSVPGKPVRRGPSRGNYREHRHRRTRRDTGSSPVGRDALRAPERTVQVRQTPTLPTTRSAARRRAHWRWCDRGRPSPAPTDS